MCSLFLVVLVKFQYLPREISYRKTTLRKLNRGEGFVSKKTRAKNAYDFLGLFYCFTVHYCMVALFPCPT